MEQKKYTLLGGDYATTWKGHTLLRIKYLRDVGDIVKAGELGGYLESYSNLSQERDCVVTGNAMVMENAMVYGNARVTGESLVRGNARVYEKAAVFGLANVRENAKVHGIATIDGEAVVKGDADISGDAYFTSDALATTGRICSGYYDRMQLP